MGLRRYLLIDPSLVPIHTRNLRLVSPNERIKSSTGRDTGTRLKDWWVVEGLNRHLTSIIVDE